MAKIISTIKAILTRIIFAAHSLIAIWQVTENKGDIIYWALCGPLGLLLLEGIFTLMIKKTQEWRWFCPSVFLYLSSIVPAIWLLELDKVELRLAIKAAQENKTEAPPIMLTTTQPTYVTTINATAPSPLDKIDNFLEKSGVPWTTLIEQFLMLILIVGRWMLPKGDLTRDQLSQLLLVYIGTAADIIEFFDSYKDDSIAEIPLLVYLTLGIWSWSLMQFTIVLSATRARRSRGGGNSQNEEQTDCCFCCGIDVWGIVLNVILQDAPFLTFRMLIIFQYNKINYMNVFFTSKNSLVILLQLYRLYVVNAEYWKHRRELKAASKARQYRSRRRPQEDEDAHSIYMISNERAVADARRKAKRAKDYADSEDNYKKNKREKAKKRKRKDTGYSTASSQNLYATKMTNEKAGRRKEKQAKRSKRDRSSSLSENEIAEARKVAKRNSKAASSSDRHDKKKAKNIEPVIEESSSTSSSSSTATSSSTSSPPFEDVQKKKSKRKRSSSSSSSSSDSSSSSTATDASDTTD